MTWLYGQAWLWYLIAFLGGLLLAWLAFVRPQQRRLKALLSRSLAPAGSVSATAAGTAPAAPAAAPDGPSGAAAASAAWAAMTARGTLPPTGSRPAADSAGDAPPEAIPAADLTADAPTDIFPAVDPALNTLDTAHLVAADAPTPPEGMPTVPDPDARP